MTAGQKWVLEALRDGQIKSRPELFQLRATGVPLVRAISEGWVCGVSHEGEFVGYRLTDAGRKVLDA